MRALTIHQPYAHYLVQGLKLFETRSWSTNYRGPLAIHAGLSLDSLEELGREGQGYPRGAIVGVAWLTDVIQVDAPSDLLGKIPYMEYEMGDWSPGRYGWRIRHPLALVVPISMPGKQGLWIPTDEQVAGIAAALP